jgi:hypothetical protein
MIGRACSIIEIRTAYKILVGKPKGKRLFGILRRRFQDNIKMEHKEIRYGGVHRINLTQYRVR